nr:unnamed protein product [Digitaria exilis]
MASPALICDTEQWKALQGHVGAIQKTHLRDLMADADRCKAMTAYAAKLKEKIEKMFKGEKVCMMM